MSHKPENARVGDLPYAYTPPSRWAFVWNPELRCWAVLVFVVVLHRAWAMGAPEVAIAGLLALVLAGGLARARPELGTRRARIALGASLGLTALFVLLPLFTQTPDRAARFFFARAIPALVGWSLVLWLPGIGSRDDDGSQAWGWVRQPSRVLLGAALVLYFATIAVLLYDAAGWYMVLQDEALYTVQSGLLTHERFGWAMTPEQIPFFRSEYVLYRDGVLTTQYAPGWPLVLRAFDLAGLRWWTNPVMAAVSVATVYWIARRLHSPLAGVVAVLLVGSQEWFVFEATGLMPHVGTAATLLVATAVLLASEAKSTSVQIALRAVAGLLLGFAVLIRPLTGVALGASIGIWMLARQEWRIRDAWKLGSPVMLGIAVPAAFVLYYNATVTGDPLVFGYKAVHGPLHDLGFGMRGFRYFYGGLEPIVAADPFTFRDAMNNLHARSWQFALQLLPVFMALPVIWLGMARGARTHWWLVAAFLLLPLGHFFHFSSRSRFYTELVPFASIGVALLIAHLAATDWRRTAMPLLAVLALLGGARMLTIDRAGEQIWSMVVDSAGKLEAAHAERGPLLVFVQEPLPEAYLFRRLWQFNTRGFDSPILVARSQGDRDRQLAATMPNRTALRAIWSGSEDEPMTLKPLK